MPLLHAPLDLLHLSTSEGGSTALYLLPQPSPMGPLLTLEQQEGWFHQLLTLPEEGCMHESGSRALVLKQASTALLTDIHRGQKKKTPAINTCNLRDTLLLSTVYLNYAISP